MWMCCENICECLAAAAIFCRQTKPASANFCLLLIHTSYTCFLDSTTCLTKIKRLWGRHRFADQAAFPSFVVNGPYVVGDIVAKAHSTGAMATDFMRVFSLCCMFLMRCYLVYLPEQHLMQHWSALWNFHPPQRSDFGCIRLTSKLSATKGWVYLTRR